MSFPIEHLSNQIVGNVEEVSADKLLVRLNADAPRATALNTGTPSAFPRINGYLLIPNEIGATIGWITSARIEPEPPPRHRRPEHLGLVDLPFPSRTLTLTPLGTLILSRDLHANTWTFTVRRGVDVLPSVGDPALLPTATQLQAIVQGESSQTPRRILIGHSPLASGAPVYVDPNKLFGRHLAVLGNTGSGKSSSVATLLRGALESARDVRRDAGHIDDSPNARFLILDPNGEYSSAFQFLGQKVVRLFQAEPAAGSNAEQLTVPAWLWNGEEWAAFSEASPGLQRPVLFEALRYLRSGNYPPQPFVIQARQVVQRYRIQLDTDQQRNIHFTQGLREGFAGLLLALAHDLQALAQDPSCHTSLRDKLNAAASAAAKLEESARAGVRERPDQYWHNPFPEVELAQIKFALDDVASCPELNADITGISEDSPIYFPISQLPGYVKALAAAVDQSRFVDSLNLRIKSLLDRGGLAQILNPDRKPSNDNYAELVDWLGSYIAGDGDSGWRITIVDLSLVPSDVVYIVVAAIARLVFEALQRYRREMQKELPTVLVLDEAHAFVHKDLAAEQAPAAGRACYRIFERIAREGRKYGLGLVVVSQRPSELSPTILSQCNTFLLHRIVNDRDQDLVKRLVPDALGGLLRELPSLPSGRAILLGWASPVPVLVEMEELPEGERPHSPDPAFWEVWTSLTNGSQRRVDWESVARNWVNGTAGGGNEVRDAESPPRGGKESGDILAGDSGDEPSLDDVPF